MYHLGTGYNYENNKKIPFISTTVTRINDLQQYSCSLNNLKNNHDKKGNWTIYQKY